MKRMFKYLLVAVVVVATLAAMTTALACTGYYVGKDASADGTYMIGHTVDGWNTLQGYVTVVEGSTEPGRVFIEGDTEIPLPDVTYQYTATPFLEWNDWANAASNEKGVSMTGSITTDINRTILEADPYTTDGAAESWITAYVVAVSSSAREAVETYGEIMETYGSSETNTFIISDQNEAWYLESYSGHQWCAVKCPDDCVAVFGNECMLGTLEDYVEGETLLHSDDFYALPEELGLAVYDEDGNFDVFASYCGDDFLDDGSNLRTWYGHFLLAPSTAGEYDTKTRYDLFYEPDEPVTLEQIFSMTRSRFEGTEYDPDETGERVRIIGVEVQASCSVIQTYPDLPAAMCVVNWTTIANAENSVFLPLSNLTAEVADIYSYVPDDYEPAYRLDVVSTHFKRLCALCETNRELYGAGVRAYWESVEADLVAEVPGMIADLADLYETNPEEVQELITAYTIRLQEQALEDADTMYDELNWYIISNTSSTARQDPDPFVPSLLETDDGSASGEASDEASGEASSEASAEASGEASGDAADASEDAYKEYLKEFVAAVPANEGVEDEFYEVIDAGTYDEFPMEIGFSGFWGEIPMTLEEFQDAGGVYEIPDMSGVYAD